LYKELIYYLQFQKFHDHFESYQHRGLLLEASKFMILENYFFHKYVNLLLLRCIDDIIAQKVLREIYGSAELNIHIGGHFVEKTTTFKILRTCYFCPSIFKYYFKFTRACDKCQKFVGKEKFYVIPLKHVISNFPFSKWGLDFIIPINPLSFVGHIFFLTTTD